VRLRRGAGDVNAFLELLLYQNQLQLATADVLYSDGTRYEPAIAAVKPLKAFLPSVKNVLLLGSGLGSMVRILHRRGCYPHFTLVENDKVVLQWAMEFLDAGTAAKTTPVCSDAMAFMANNTAKYDLVFIDVFMGRVVPLFVFTPAFLTMCKDSLNAGGHVAFNYIINNDREWEKVLQVFTLIFSDHKVVNKGVNRILIGHV
jgi:spermidine synthase